MKIYYKTITVLVEVKITRTRRIVIPIENERKFVLKLKTKESSFAKIAEVVNEIEQFYLISGKNQSLRCRKAINNGKNYSLTFKQEVDGKIVEIETSIDERDYEMLKSKSKSILTKTRYHIEEEGQMWEVDFFKNDKNTYFVQAEAELPEEQIEPKKLLKLVKKNLIHIVKQGDKKFSSRRLCSVKHAKKLLKHIKERN